MLDLTNTRLDIDAEDRWGIIDESIAREYICGAHMNRVPNNPRYKESDYEAELWEQNRVRA